MLLDPAELAQLAHDRLRLGGILAPALDVIRRPGVGEDRRARLQETSRDRVADAGPTADARDDYDPTGERGWGAGHARIVARQQRPS